MTEIQNQQKCPIQTPSTRIFHNLFKNTIFHFRYSQDKHDKIEKQMWKLNKNTTSSRRFLQLLLTVSFPIYKSLIYKFLYQKSVHCGKTNIRYIATCCGNYQIAKTNTRTERHYIFLKSTTLDSMERPLWSFQHIAKVARVI